MKISVVIMASGISKRFGENKLLYNFNGKPLIENVFVAIKNSIVDEVVVVTRYDEILKLSKSYGFKSIVNVDTTDDLSKTIKLGVSVAKSSNGIMLCVADQPFLSSKSIDKLCNAFTENQDKICALSINGEMGNPVIFPENLFEELMNLPPFSRGKSVLLNHKELIKLVEVGNADELYDIDTKNNLSTKIGM